VNEGLTVWGDKGEEKEKRRRREGEEKEKRRRREGEEKKKRGGNLET
jgi:hypothetical protein